MDRDAVIVGANVARAVGVVGVWIAVSGARRQGQVKRTRSFHHGTVKRPRR